MVECCHGEESGPFCWPVLDEGIECVSWSISWLVVLVLARIQKAAVGQASSRPPNGDHDLFGTSLVWKYFGALSRSWQSWSLLTIIFHPYYMTQSDEEIVHLLLQKTNKTEGPATKGASYQAWSPEFNPWTHVLEGRPGSWNLSSHLHMLAGITCDTHILTCMEWWMNEWTNEWIFRMLREHKWKYKGKWFGPYPVLAATPSLVRISMNPWALYKFPCM